jgi:hypothetical protein
MESGVGLFVINLYYPPQEATTEAKLKNFP